MDKIKFIRIFSAWIERHNISDEEASKRLSKYRRVTVEQVKKIKVGSIYPTHNTIEAWSVEINSQPESKVHIGAFTDDIPDALKDLFGGFNKR